MPPDLSTSRWLPLDDDSGRSADKTLNALAGGFGGLAGISTVLGLGRSPSEEQRRYGDRLWDHVDKDAVAGSCVDLLTYITLSNDLGVVPAYEPPPGDEPATPEEQLDYENAIWAADLVATTMDNLASPFHATAREHLKGALKWGSSVADLVWDQPTTGPDAGELILKAIKPKDRRAWYFEVDPYFDLKYIVGASAPAAGAGMVGWTRWPREKFAVVTWGGRGGDPRGESIYTRAVEPWNFRAQMPEDHFRFLKRFGTPKVVGHLSPGSMAGGDDGTPQDARTYNPLKAFLGRLLNWINGSALAVGIADIIKVHEVQTDGRAFQQAWDMYGREIAIAILLQTRATMEARHGSRADSGTGQDILGNIIRFIRRLYCQVLETDVFFKIVAYQKGEDFARKYTPGASLGETEHQDIVMLMQGLASLGYQLDPSQYPAADKMLGFLPVRKSAEMTGEADVQGAEGEAENANQPKPGTDGASTPASAKQRVVVARAGQKLKRGVYVGG